MSEPIVPSETRKLMNDLALGIDYAVNPGIRKKEPRKIGFVLLTFPFGVVEGARANYISNGADRKEIVILMKELIARFEGQPEVEGRA